MRKYAVILFSLFITTPVWAGSESNDCERLHVQIGNMTSTSCQLVSSNVIHGNLVTPPPATIPAGFTGQFDIKQTFHGPNVVLQYACNGEQVTFSSQQNYCFMKAGQITGTIVSSSSNIHGSFTAEEGSYFWSKPGLINWLIS